jgi:hypothetical protein
LAGVAVPRAERSGSHRVVEVEVGDVREAIATIAGVATLARAQGVGPKALRDLLPGLRSTCLAAPSVVAAALIPACDVVALSTGLDTEARNAVDALVAAARKTTQDVLSAVDASESKGLGARTRLALQAACDRAVEDLARVRYAIELLQRSSTGEPLPVALEDLLRELDGGDLGGTPIELTLIGDLDDAIAVNPRIGTAVLLGALSTAHATLGGHTFVAEARLDRERNVVIVTFRRRTSADPESPTVRVTVPEPAPYDALVLSLVAATQVSPVVGEGRAVHVHLLLA